ncbi:uncharacterized protein BDW47DRAFT_106892 [Aspergillus candidus]|uniref:BHLH domain-containing protein n=1 Tax=Aspergillus candidus TaxID=41067 RepID=A0A2I2F9Q7_ASPCN|nr:hypothetical protein BDW47DRAFT_106892 [Aspergillus candidus]PLB37364.1 hypothetical protein BDW47DRAFT_106892 [Aspergillus candidus]
MPSAQPPSIASLASSSSDPSDSPFPGSARSPSSSTTPTASSARQGASSSAAAAAAAAAAQQEKDKPRLTEQEKKNNHIASEQKRRAAIREGFDRLTELVPGLEGQGRSESIVLKKTVDFMQMQMQERQDLIAEIEGRGGRVEDGFRLP